MSMDVYTESSGVETSPEQDMNSSTEIPSPERLNVQPRKLMFGLSPEIENNPVQKDYLQANLTLSPTKQPSISPPYRRVKALRLFDSPATPKTIIEKSKTSKYLKHLAANNVEVENLDVLAKPIGLFNIENSTPFPQEKPRAVAVPIHKPQETYSTAANVNPFTPKGMMMRNNKRSLAESQNYSFNLDLSSRNTFAKDLKPSRHSIIPLTNFEHYLSDEDQEIKQAPKRLALQDSNISRYEKEFMALSLIGTGEFGMVSKCLNRLDGCIYAIKKSIKPVAGSVFEKTALNEVYAHAVLGKHENVVRYYSAWAENNHMLIQNEYCNGGSLQSIIQNRDLSESELKTLLMHIGEGLKYIHSNDLVHMDLKAGNIFLTKVPPRPTPIEYCDDGFEDVFEETENESTITYKIGDLGHVTSINDPQVEEGDCRYLPNEILQEDYSHLQKADIFSLGITLYEAGGGKPLPKNGPEWHRLRNGNVPDLAGISREFNDLIKLMTHPDPNKRPTSSSIFYHPVLCPCESKTKAQLSHELIMERQKNEFLLKKLKEARKILKSYELCKTPVGKRSKHSPIVSDRKLRSFSRKKQRHSSYTNNRRSLKDSNKNIINNDHNDF